MMLLADVTKIKCKFVSEVIAFLNKRKYAIDPCIKCKYTYYADLLKVLYGATSVEGDDTVISYTCLEHDAECDLTAKANKYSAPTTVCASSEQCSDQATITLAQATRTCTGVAETLNATCNCKYPNITLNNNSEYIDANINVKYTFSGTCANPPVTSTYNVEGGCSLADGCVDANRGIYSFGFNSDVSAAVNSSSYLKEIKAYKTDATGTGANVIVLNVHNTASPYLVDDPTDCPGCTTVLSAELVFGHANFSDAFATLMDNISLALFGATGHHRMSATWANNKLRLRCTAVHNPTSGLFGLMSPGEIKIWTPTISTVTIGGPNAFGDDDVAPYHRPIRFYEELPEVDAPSTIYSCANLEATIGDQITYPRFNTALSNFKNIALSAPIGLTGYPIEVTDNAAETCDNTILSAVVTTTQDIASISWEDPSSNEISTSTLALAEDPGTYTFIVTLENGCVISETILVD